VSETDDGQDLAEQWDKALTDLGFAARMLSIEVHLRDWDYSRSPPDVQAAAAPITAASDDRSIAHVKECAALLLAIEGRCVEAGIDPIDLVLFSARRMDPWYVPCFLALRSAVRTMGDKDLWVKTARDFNRQWIEAEEVYGPALLDGDNLPTGPSEPGE
jgi:hypothetical protein